MPKIIASTYEVIEKLGSGGGGNVYLAQHLRLKKKVVLKVDKRKLSASKELLRREVDILKELSHPYIPRVYDFFVVGEEVYTVMDYIEGESLDKALKRGEKFSQPQVIRWACQLLDALCYLHSPTHGDPPKGFVHSDIKPANLMRTSEGNICLIDFNIALALGEENVIGCSAGYASPEHYGLDFSVDEETGTAGSKRDGNGEDMTVTLPVDSGGEEATETIAQESLKTPKSLSSLKSSGSSSLSGSSSSMRKKIITPDVRSDIYSVGATLYHLLNGKRPSKNAKEVAPLSEEQFSLQVVQIISRAMNPNPDLRYQSAAEMMDAFRDLRKTDPRVRKWRRHRRAVAAIFLVLFAIGGLTAFTGLKRMQMMERWINLVKYSQEALAKGNIEEAVSNSMQVLADSSGQFMPEYVPGAQKTLAEALGVYDLSDGYKMYKTIELPSAPLFMAISPDGKTGAALYGQTVAVFDTTSAEVIAELPVETSALSEIRFLDNNVLIYAGKGGITAYDTHKAQELWKGNIATAISISGDGTSVAGIYEGETYATVYDARTGEVKAKIDFKGKKQDISINNNLFSLNYDGSLLGTSFQDGSLQIYDLRQPEKECIILNSDSGYTHFEGGFFGQYFSFSASNQEKSLFAVVDSVKGEEIGGFQAETALKVQADESGIYVQSDNILVKMDPITGEQEPLVTMEENIFSSARSKDYTIVTSENELFFFDKDAQLISRYEKEYRSDLVCIADGSALVGSMDRPVIRIMKYESNQDAGAFSYDSSYRHSEARISADEETVTLFSYDQFRIYDREGNLIQEVFIPDADHVIDQQFIREEDGSYLEITYNDGKVSAYSAKDGKLLWTETRAKTDDLDEEFLVSNFRIESPLHGTPIVYDQESEKEVARLKKDTYLTYVTEADGYIVAQYMTADGVCSGQLLNKKCEVLAELPYLSDVVGKTLIFDYPTGNIRRSQIYSVEELMNMAGKML